MATSQARILQAARKMTPGTFGGQSRVATPCACKEEPLTPFGTAPCVSVGGLLTYEEDGYYYHVWNEPGTYTFEPCRYLEIEYLVVAGGGASLFGEQAAGGGGGGGMLDSDTGGTISFSEAQEIHVGVGGTSSGGPPWDDPGGSAIGHPGARGFESHIGVLLVAEGGGRTSTSASFGFENGGSGGGGNSGVLSGNPGLPGGFGTPGQGYDGGDGSFGTSSTGARNGGGGGGAGGPGTDAVQNVSAGVGGPGREWPAGSGNYYGGGGGAGWRAHVGGAGGIGGGGAGSAGNSINPSNGVPGTGGGGGGTGFGATGGGSGGHGIVIIRYPSSGGAIGPVPPPGGGGPGPYPPVDPPPPPDPEPEPQEPGAFYALTDPVVPQEIADDDVPPDPPDPPVGVVFGKVVYTAAEINAWSTSDPQYAQLAATSQASLSKIPVAFGTQISSAERDTGLRDQSGYAKIQAVLWAADGNAARLAKVYAYLDEYRTVTSVQWDSSEQWRLVLGWSITNLCQAAAITGYSDPDFDRFLVDVAYPVMDWTATSNWTASFADSKLAIAAYVEDPALWADAKAYFYERLAQNIYHPTYDGATVEPWHTQDNNQYAGTSGSIGGSGARLHTSAGTPNLTSTKRAWGGGISAAVCQINDDYTIKLSVTSATPGINGEQKRDYAHVNLSLGGWTQAARTILANGDTLTGEAYDRILEAWDYHAQRVLTYRQTGVMPWPQPVQGDGGSGLVLGYQGAKKFLGLDTPASVNGMLARTEVYSAHAGTLHLIAGPFADG